MIVKCEVPSSPTTYEEELMLVSTLALEGHDFETPHWRGVWHTPKCFVVTRRAAHVSPIPNAALMWLSEYKQWYQPRNGIVGTETSSERRNEKYNAAIPTKWWDPQPVAVNWADMNILYRVGPDGLAMQKLGVMTDKLAQLKEHWK